MVARGRPEVRSGGACEVLAWRGRSRLGFGQALGLSLAARAEFVHAPRSSQHRFPRQKSKPEAPVHLYIGALGAHFTPKFRRPQLRIVDRPSRTSIRRPKNPQPSQSRHKSG